jgi:DNA-binding transcriptional MerR regulator
MTTTETNLTIEQIIDQARSENLSNKKIRSLLFHNGFDHKVEFPAVRDALGREKGDSGEANRQAKLEAEAKADEARKAREAEYAKERAEKEAAEKKARAEWETSQAKAKEAIADGAVIWCDAAENTVTRVVNRFGRKAKYDNGGYRIGLLAETDDGEYEAREYNTRCPDQFAGECFAVLKAVELAADCRAKKVTIRNDRIGGFEASTKRGYIGAKYLWVAKNMAEENGLGVTFDVCSGAENRADRISRTEG